MSNISKDLLTNSNSSSALIRLQCSDSVDVNSTEYQNSAISTSCSDINMENSENQKFNAKQNKRIHEHKVNLNSSQILSIYQQALVEDENHRIQDLSTSNHECDAKKNKISISEEENSSINQQNLSNSNDFESIIMTSTSTGSISHKFIKIAGKRLSKPPKRIINQQISQLPELNLASIINILILNYLFF